MSDGDQSGGGQTGDADLLARAVTGDPSASQALFARHYLAIRRFFELNATWVAEDLTQRTFVACLERLASVPVGGFRPYLFGIARNQLKMYLRHAAVRGVHDDPAPQARATGVSTIVARSQEQRRLLVALGRLGTDERIAVTLHYWDELSSAELGQALGIPAATVRTRLARARHKLRTALSKHGGGTDEDLEAALRQIGPRLDPA